MLNYLFFLKKKASSISNFNTSEYFILVHLKGTSKVSDKKLQYQEILIDIYNGGACRK